MRRLGIRVYYDFASTICYVAHRVMDRMQADLDELAIDLEWTPVDLVRITGWRRGDPIEGVRSQNALRVASDLGVEVRLPPRWPDSRSANAAALSLAGTPHDAAWRERVFSALHEQGRDIASTSELAAMARDLDLAFPTLANDESLTALEVETERARDAEVTGVPTFMLASWPFGGIQEEPTMRSLLSRWAAKQRRNR